MFSGSVDLSFGSHSVVLHTATSLSSFEGQCVLSCYHIALVALDGSDVLCDVLIALGSQTWRTLWQLSVLSTLKHKYTTISFNGVYY